jgi:hypothetical protein
MEGTDPLGRAADHDLLPFALNFLPSSLSSGVLV